MKLCKRLISGDLSYQFEHEVINQPQSEERDSMMAVMNIMCGHIEFDCAYASGSFGFSIIQNLIN